MCSRKTKIHLQNYLENNPTEDDEYEYKRGIAQRNHIDKNIQERIN
jgi:hypothetical protein